MNYEINKLISVIYIRKFDYDTYKFNFKNF